MKRAPISYLALQLALAGTLLAAQPATAAPVQITAQATVDDASFGTAQYIALGTTLTANIRMDVTGAPAPGSSGLSITNVQGTFSWNDGSARAFDLGPVSLTSTGTNGNLEIFFEGSGPTINAWSASDVGITFNLGLNPFASSEDWETLLLGSNITGLAVMAGPGNFFTRLDARQEVSGNIVALAQTVPEPGSLALAALALAALWASRGGQRRAHQTPDDAHVLA